MSINILSLPVEVIQLICGALEPKDLASLRLGCKDLERISLKHFGLKTLGEVRTDLSFKSLERLQKIGNRDGLAPYIECMRVTDVDRELGQGLRWNQKLSQYPATSMIGYDWLSDILVKKFVNCRSFRIDIYRESWAHVQKSPLTPSDAINVIFSILGEHQLPIRSFIVEDRVTSRNFDTSRLQISQGHIDQCKLALVRLETLVFNFPMEPNQYDWAHDLIMRSPNLRKLSLDRSDHDNPFLKHLKPGQPPLKLEDLNLQQLCTTEAVISNFLVQSRDTLSVLRLDGIFLDGDDAWVTLLGKMRGTFPQLRRFLVVVLIGYNQGNLSRAIFPRLTDNPLLPGCKKRTLDDDRGLVYDDIRLVYDRRLSKGLQCPLELLYWSNHERVIGVGYVGPDMDLFLDMLAETAEWETRPI